MSRTFSKQTLVNAIKTGIQNAVQAYEHGAGWALDYAPEYFVTTHIFEAIRKARNVGYVTLEGHIGQTLDSAGPKQRGRPLKLIAGAKRVDIWVWNSNEKPRVAIEVKSPAYLTSANLRKDVDRIKALLTNRGNASTLKYGALAMYTSRVAPAVKHESSRHWLEKQLKVFEEYFQSCSDEAVSVEFCHGSVKTHDDRSWVACYVIVTRR